MAKYIDKSALVAEIEKLFEKGKCHEEYDCGYRDGRNGVLYELQGKIDTLKVKEVDLEKEIEEYLSIYWSNEKDLHPFLGHVAKHFFELGMQQSKNYNNNGE